jgi:hypothetical protein
MVACGPALVGSGIPEWFNDKSTNSFGTIQVHTDLRSDLYALFIVYEFHETHTHTHPRKRRKHKVDERKGNWNSSTFDGDNPNIPNFVCQFQYQVNGVDVIKPLVVCAPGVPSVGPNGFWVYLRASWFKTSGGGSLKVSITTSSLNAEVKECGARVVRDEHDASELYQLLNTISPRGLCLKSYEKLLSVVHKQDWPYHYLSVKGPIIVKSNGVASGSTGSVNCQHLLKKSERKKIRLIQKRLMGIKGKQKMLTFPISQRIRGKPTKKRRRIEHE